jgi:hypothetical protein
MTSPAILFSISIAGLLFLIICELSVKREQLRFVLQIGYLLVWILFLALTLSAFILPMYIPEVRIA